MMLAEMSGPELQDWKAYFELKEESRRDAALDAKGKAALAKLM